MGVTEVRGEEVRREEAVASREERKARGVCYNISKPCMFPYHRPRPQTSRR